MLGWYDANVGVDQAADAGAVSSWSDRSGNGRTLTQGTGANQPTYRALGHYGKRSVRGDGSNDKLANTSGAPFHGRTTATILVVFSATTAIIDRYFISQPEATAGTNGVDIRMRGSGLTRTFTKSDTGTGELDVGTLYSSAGRAVALEVHWDMDRGSQEVVGTASSTGFNYLTRAGATLDASGGEFVLFDFSSSGFSAAAAVDIHEVTLLTRPMGAGERRRWYRYVQQRWGILRPYGPWHDGTLTVTL